MHVTASHTVSQPHGLPVERILCADSLGRSLLEVSARGAGRHGEGLGRIPVLGRRGHLPGDQRRTALAREAGAEALPFARAGEVDAAAVAEWITGRHAAAEYPAVVLGSPHGSAVHLAAALGAAWLPTGFAVTFSWPGGSPGDWSAAMEWGADLATRVLARNPDVTVRQVHDPLLSGPLCGTTVTLHLRWRTLPPAYLRFLRTRVAPGGALLLLRDLRTWPVLPVSPGSGFQLGSPVGGWSPADYTAENPAFRRLLDEIGTRRWAQPYAGTPIRYAERAGEPALDAEARRAGAEDGRRVVRVLYGTPDILSACVADLYRLWLRDVLDGGDDCVVETGRLLDPWQALAGGLVPYWCESAARSAVDAVRWWLAGSEPFTSVTVLPEAPGHAGDAFATLPQWRSVAAFGRQRARLDRLAASRYPTLPLAVSHATRVLADAGTARVAPPRMTVPYVLDHLHRWAGTPGVLVS